MSRKSLLLLYTAVLFSFSFALDQDNALLQRANSTAPIVDLGYAKYQGVVDATRDVTNFLGIRYAAAPVGDLRWRAPQAPANVSDVQIADTEPNMCFQASTGAAATSPLRSSLSPGLTRRAATATPVQSEDCLFLNVAIPGDSVPSRPLPVVVWIHGGGYVGGSASTFTGADLVNEASNGTIAVLIQYRLGVFGFLAGSKVKQNGTLNVGLVDQEFALRWVQTHISKFGGDPDKVTIWGESAGAGSVLQHVIAHDGRTEPQLFRAAMTSSTFLPSQYPFNDPISEGLYSEFVSQTNCTSATDTLACLRAVDVQILQNANFNVNIAGFFGTFVTVPVIDGEFITQRPIEAMKQRKVNGRGLLAVTNANEGLVFVNQTAGAVTDIPTYVANLFPKFGAQEDAEVANLYAGLGTPLQQANLIMGETIFICPTYYLLRAFEGSIAFKGEFGIPPATHGMDVGFYFPTNSILAFPNVQFQNAFSESFLSFVVNLNPNDKVAANIVPSWNEFVYGNTEMLFNETTSSQPLVESITTSSALLDRCSFWEGKGELTGQ